jgi:hypothetical protein
MLMEAQPYRQSKIMLRRQFQSSQGIRLLATVAT